MQPNLFTCLKVDNAYIQGDTASFIYNQFFRQIDGEDALAYADESGSCFLLIGVYSNCFQFSVREEFQIDLPVRFAISGRMKYFYYISKQKLHKYNTHHQKSTICKISQGIVDDLYCPKYGNEIYINYNDSKKGTFTFEIRSSKRMQLIQRIENAPNNIMIFKNIESNLPELFQIIYCSDKLCTNTSVYQIINNRLRRYFQLFGNLEYNQCKMWKNICFIKVHSNQEPYDEFYKEQFKIFYSTNQMKQIRSLYVRNMSEYSAKILINEDKLFLRLLQETEVLISKYNWWTGTLCKFQPTFKLFKNIRKAYYNYDNNQIRVTKYITQNKLKKNNKNQSESEGEEFNTDGESESDSYSEGV